MQFSDFVLSPVNLEKRTTDKMGKSIAIKYEAFMAMMTANGFGRRISNPWLVSACMEELQRNTRANVEISSIFIERESILKIDDENRQLIKVTDQELLEAEVESLIGSRVIIKIVAHGLHDEIFPSLAISLNEDGEEIALGENVSICNNFTIFGADRYHSTFARHADNTKQRLSTTELREVINKLFPKTEVFLEDDLKLIENLKSQPVTRPGWYQFTGELFGQIHYVNRMRLARRIKELPREVKELPITATILADIAAEAEAPAHVEYSWEQDRSNKWNVINYGTELLKVEHGISPRTVLENNFHWTDMVMKRNFSPPD